MANLYIGNGAESNRSANLYLKAVLTFNDSYSATQAKVTVSYTINKNTSTNFTDPNTRYGLLVQNASVDTDNGKLTSGGSILGSVKLAQIEDKKGDQTGTATFLINKSSTEKQYTGVTFLINDNTLSVKRSSDSTFLWTGERGSSRNSTPINFATTHFKTSSAYTKCSAPTTISISKTIQTPSGQITLSWSGAKGGNNNGISSYEIYRSSDGNNYTKLTTVSSTSPSGSYSTTAPTTRGTSYWYKIKTIGGAGASWASNFSSTKKVKANTLPTLDSVILDYERVPYSGDSVKITELSGNTNDTEQSISYYYKREDDEAYIECKKGTSIKIPASNQEETNESYKINFYAFDGLESSTITTINIVRCAQPAITTTLTPIGDSETVYVKQKDGSLKEYSYYKNFQINIEAIDRSGFGGDFTYEYRLYTSSSWADGEKYITLSTNIEEKTYNFKTTDFSKLKVPYKVGDKLWVRGVCYLEIENCSKEISNISTFDASSLITLPEYSSYISSNNGVADFNPLYFDDILAFSFSKDTGIISTSVKCKNKNTGAEFIFSSTNITLDNSDESETKVKIKCKNLLRGNTYAFSITLSRGDNTEQTYTIEDLFTRILQTPFFGGDINPKVFDVRETSTQLNATVYYNISSTFTKEDFALYGLIGLTEKNENKAISKVFINNVKIIAKYKSQSYEAIVCNDETYFTPLGSGLSISDNSIVLSAITAKFFPTTINGSAIVDFYCEVENVFGTLYSIKIGSVTYDFNKKFKITKEKFYYKLIEGNDLEEINENNDPIFRNGTSINFQIEDFKIYNTTPISISLFVGYGDKEEQNNIIYSEIASEIFYESSINTLSGISLLNKNFLFESLPFLQTSSKYVYLKVEVSQGNFSEIFMCSIQPRTLKHIEGNIAIENCNFEKQNTGLILYPIYNIIENIGLIDDTEKQLHSLIGLKTELYFVDGENKIKIGEKNERGVEASFLLGEITEEIIGKAIPSIIPIEIQVTSEDLETKAFLSYYSAIYYVYYQTPTFSYRKNQVAINCKPEDFNNQEETALYLSAYDDKDKIYFQDKKAKTIMSFDLAEDKYVRCYVNERPLSPPFTIFGDISHDKLIFSCSEQYSFLYTLLDDNSTIFVDFDYTSEYSEEQLKAYRKANLIFKEFSTDDTGKKNMVFKALGKTPTVKIPIRMVCIL